MILEYEIMCVMSGFLFLLAIDWIMDYGRQKNWYTMEIHLYLRRPRLCHFDHFVVVQVHQHKR